MRPTDYATLSIVRSISTHEVIQLEIQGSHRDYRNPLICNYPSHQTLKWYLRGLKACKYECRIKDEKNVTYETYLTSYCDFKAWRCDIKAESFTAFANTIKAELPALEYSVQRSEDKCDNDGYYVASNNTCIGTIQLTLHARTHLVAKISSVYQNLNHMI